MRVCVLTSSFPRWRSDQAGHFVFDLARHLVGEGVSVVVVAPRGDLPDGSAAAVREEWDGVEIVRFPYFLRRWESLSYGSGIPAHLRAHAVRSLFLLPFFAAGFARAARRAARGCDLIHAHWVFSALIARWAARARPLVLTVRGSDLKRLPHKGVVGRVVGGVLQKVDALAAVSADLAGIAAQRGVAPDRIQVIRNGVAMPSQVEMCGSGSGRILWAGRMTEEKGLTTLIEAFAAVRREVPSARLVLVGDGPERAGLEHAAARLGLADAASFEGVQPFERMGGYYAEADVLALSSLSEGTPNVVLEAMAHGVPPVSTAVGGVGEIVTDGVSGRLVPPRDAPALATALAALLRDPQERNRMGRAAREAVEPLTWQRAAREYKAVYTKVLADSASAGQAPGGAASHKAAARASCPCSTGWKPVPPRLSLRRNFWWTFAGNTVHGVCRWGVLIVLSKLGTKEMVGQFALGLAVCEPVVAFCSLALRPVLATDARREFLFGHYLALRLVTSGLALLVLAGIAALGGHGPQMACVILALALAKGFEALSDVFYGRFQQWERMDLMARSLMLRGVASLAALAAAVALTGSVAWGCAGLALAWGIVLASYDVRQSRMPNAECGMRTETANRKSQIANGERVRPVWEWARLSRLALRTLPLGFALVLLSLNVNIPRYFIREHGGDGELGIFAALAYLMVAANTVIGALGASASPRLARHYAEGELARFRGLLLRLVSIGALLGVAGFVVALGAGRPLLALLYRPEYAERADVFVWLMAAAAATYVSSFLGYGMTATRYFLPQPVLFGCCTAATAVLCALLVPAHGLRGAVVAIGAASLLQAVGTLLCIAHALRARRRQGAPAGGGR